MKNAIYTDPEDQSAWLYYWWLLGRAPDNVALYGAYQIESDPTLILLGFNDRIKFLQMPRLLNERDETISYSLYPFDSKNNSASIWILQTSDKQIAKRVAVESSVILPSTSAKSVPHDKVWSLELKKLDRNSGKYTCNIRELCIKFIHLFFCHVRVFEIKSAGGMEITCN